MKKEKTVVLGITGGIAAYKAADIVSQLGKIGVCVHVIMTKHATEFITPLTLQTLSNNPVVTDMFERTVKWEIEHISLAQKADLFLIAPASANFIGKLASGVADDMLTTTVMATKAKIMIAPAMNTNMYFSPIVQRNIRYLKELGYLFIEPSSGKLACGDIGVGKLAPVEEIIDKTVQALYRLKDYEGKTVLVTAGPTREAIDPVRYISNRSSGKMGYAIAEAASERGAKVILVSGPTHLSPPANVQFISVESTEDMYRAVIENFACCDMLIKAAAPSDFKPKEFQGHKIKKDSMVGSEYQLMLKQNPDILKELGKQKTTQVLVGFAAETDHMMEYAQRKLQEKNLDMIVVNDVTQEGAGFDGDTNIVRLIKRKGPSMDFPQMQKVDLAHHILSEAIKIQDL